MFGFKIAAGVRTCHLTPPFTGAGINFTPDLLSNRTIAPSGAVTNSPLRQRRINKVKSGIQRVLNKVPDNAGFRFWECEMLLITPGSSTLHKPSDGPGTHL
jgi:hypothetical protein